MNKILAASRTVGPGTRGEQRCKAAHSSLWPLRHASFCSRASLNLRSMCLSTSCAPTDSHANAAVLLRAWQACSRCSVKFVRLPGRCSGFAKPNTHQKGLLRRDGTPALPRQKQSIPSQRGSGRCERDSAPRISPFIGVQGQRVLAIEGIPSAPGRTETYKKLLDEAKPKNTGRSRARRFMTAVDLQPIFR